MTDDPIDIDAVPDDILRDALRQTTTLQSDGRDCLSCGAQNSVHAHIGSPSKRVSYEFCLKCGEYYEVAFPSDELIRDHARELSTKNLEYIESNPEAPFDDISILARLRDKLRDAIEDDEEWIILHRTELELDSDSDRELNAPNENKQADEGEEDQR